MTELQRQPTSGTGPLTFLLDEHHRGVLWRYIQRHNVRTAFHPLDVVRVGDPEGLPLGAHDSEILACADRERRILVSYDRATLPGHLTDHIASGHTSPGIFLTRAAPLAEIVEFLVAVAYASEAVEWENQVTFIP
jgi:hypothetical protein